MSDGSLYYVSIDILSSIRSNNVQISNVKSSKKNVGSF